MNFESLSIADLKRQSARCRSLADAIDAAVASLEKAVTEAGRETPQVGASTQAKPTGVLEPAARKGKQPGSISQKWKGVLWEMAEIQHPSQGIATVEIASIVDRKLRQTKRPAELARQFKPYIEVGYLVQPFGDRYLVTERGKTKIDYSPASELKLGPATGQFTDPSSPKEGPGE